jgi:hypothetical protein
VNIGKTGKSMTVAALVALLLISGVVVQLSGKKVTENEFPTMADQEDLSPAQYVKPSPFRSPQPRTVVGRRRVARPVAVLSALDWQSQNPLPVPRRANAMQLTSQPEEWQIIPGDGAEADPQRPLPDSFR